MTNCECTLDIGRSHKCCVHQAVIGAVERACNLEKSHSGNPRVFLPASLCPHLCWVTVEKWTDVQKDYKIKALRVLTKFYAWYCFGSVDFMKRRTSLLYRMSHNKL